MTSEKKPLISNSSISLNCIVREKSCCCQEKIHRTSGLLGTLHVIPVTLPVQGKLQGKLSKASITSMSSSLLPETEKKNPTCFSPTRMLSYRSAQTSVSISFLPESTGSLTQSNIQVKLSPGKTKAVLVGSRKTLGSLGNIIISPSIKHCTAILSLLHQPAFPVLLATLKGHLLPCKIQVRHC